MLVNFDFWFFAGKNPWVPQASLEPSSINKKDRLGGPSGSTVVVFLKFLLLNPSVEFKPRRG